MSLTFEEKINNFTDMLNAAASKLGCVFIQDSGEGHDLETVDMYLEDVSGWLVPKGTPEEEARRDEFYRFAEWKDNGPEGFSIEFVIH
ncbi:MAG: hypothetical protein IJS45_07600 [Clostridia bacterium]|nr:hypothetical protein [Clostridia bacterium]